MIRVATLAAAYSANKGAASMVQALVDNLPERLGQEVRFVAVSTHPEADRRAYARAGMDVDVASQRPEELALLHVPLAVLAGALRKVGLPWRWVCRPAALRAIADADVVADLSGISFVDGRRFVVLIYNALVVAVPLLLGRPVVKCSQAMGPFEKPVNRRLARLVLPRLAAVCPRGEATERHLRELGAAINLVPATDLAFTMRVPDEVRKRMRERLESAATGPYLVVAPSQVVDTYCRQRGIDYVGIMAELIDAVGDRLGQTPVMIAHSAQPDKGVNHMNDLPLCREIFGRLTTDRVVFFDEDLSPTELRAVIGMGSALVTSRFHAMISALVERTPLLVVGWSHKYGEVLAQFGLVDAAMTYAELTTGAALLARVEDVLKAGGDQVAVIERQLPAVTAAAGESFRALTDALGVRGGQ